MRVETKSESETGQFAADFAEKIKNPLKNKALTILLFGNLGMGKSVFSRNLIRSLTKMPDLNVPSPTFTLVETYENGGIPIHHLDLYRLEDPDEIFELGWEDIIHDGLTLIEWPERLGSYTPQNAIEISIQNGETSNTRIITVQGVEKLEE